MLDASLPKGTRIWVAGWKKTGDDGSKYVSLALSVSADNDNQRPAPSRQQPQRAPMDDEIPF